MSDSITGWECPECGASDDLPDPQGTHIGAGGQLCLGVPVERTYVAVGQLIDALRFYADPHNYLDASPGEWTVIPGNHVSGSGFAEDEFEFDHGERARAAIDAVTKRGGS